VPEAKAATLTGKHSLTLEMQRNRWCWMCAWSKGCDTDRQTFINTGNAKKPVMLN